MVSHQIIEESVYFIKGRFASAGDSKKKLVVSVSRSQAAKHHKDFRAVVFTLWDKLVELKSACKETALQMRADLLA